MKSLLVEADVSESNIEKIKVNQDCEIILDAYPEKVTLLMFLRLFQLLIDLKQLFLLKLDLRIMI